MDDAAFTFTSHDRDNLESQFMPAEQVSAKLCLKCIPAEIFYCTGLAVSPIVEKSVEFSIGEFQCFRHPVINTAAIADIDLNCIKARVSQSLNVLSLSCARNNVKALLSQHRSCTQPNAAGATSDKYSAR